MGEYVIHPSSSVICRLKSFVDVTNYHTVFGYVLIITKVPHSPKSMIPVVIVLIYFYLIISVCSEYNHVRTWSVTRFRGMISTQPGSTPLASFKVISLEDYDPQQSYMAGNDFGECQQFYYGINSVFFFSYSVSY